MYFDISTHNLAPSYSMSKFNHSLSLSYPSFCYSLFYLISYVIIVVVLVLFIYMFYII